MNQKIKKGLLTFCTFLFSCLFVTQSCFACSAFCIDRQGQLIIGRNDDWNFDEGMIVVNKRNQTKIAFAYGWENTNNPARWVSKYGSITFVQYGRENAFGGMNEAGLVVHSLQLLPTRYPAVDPRPDLSSDQYVQFLLDNYQSVAEIIASDKFIRLRPSSGMHFFAVDNSGDSVVIEFLYGKTVIHAKEKMPIKVLTNDPYEESVNYLQQTGMRSIPNYNESSLNRFVITAAKKL